MTDPTDPNRKPDRNWIGLVGEIPSHVVRPMRPADQAAMSAKIEPRSNILAFKPERVFLPPSGDPPRDWVINDIRVGNISMIPRTRLGRLWMRITNLWRRATRRFRKPPNVRLL